MTGFAQLGISADRVARLTAQGIQNPTPVQEAAIPLVLQGRDVIGQAQTGTGKTLAFVLPILDKINVKSDKLQGLIVTPTRELALQITNEVKQLIGPEDGIRVLPVYGGQDVEAQLLKLKGNIHLIIATPGRLLDHLRRETVSLFSVQMLVLDEADQMLHMGFLGEVEEILRHMSSQRQTLLFSATMPGKIRELASQILRKPEEVTVKAQQVTVKDISQLVIETSDRAKQSALVETIRDTRPYLGMIFCRTKRRANTLNEALQQMGFESDELHGDLSQAKREQVMKKFREAKLQLLVATDVAARGLDVEGVTHVYNYDIPHDVESYIHRIGRTGRAGGSGMAITFAAPKDRPELARIEEGIGMKIQRQSYGSYIPDDDVGETPARSKSGPSRRVSGAGASSSRSGGFKKAPGEGRPKLGVHGRSGGNGNNGEKRTPSASGAAEGKFDRAAGARGPQAGGSRRDSRGGRSEGTSGNGASGFGRGAGSPDRRGTSAGGSGKGFGGGRGGSERSPSVRGDQGGRSERGASARSEQGGRNERSANARGEQGGRSERSANARGEQGGRSERSANARGEQGGRNERSANARGEQGGRNERSANVRGEQSRRNDRGPGARGGQGARGGGRGGPAGGGAGGGGGRSSRGSNGGGNSNRSPRGRSR